MQIKINLSAPSKTDGLFTFGEMHFVNFLF